MTTIFDLFEQHCKLTPNKTFHTFVDDNGNDVTKLTFDEFRNRYDAVASFLLSSNGANLTRGDRVLLVYSPSLEYAISLAGSGFVMILATKIFFPTLSACTIM